MTTRKRKTKKQASAVTSELRETFAEIEKRYGNEDHPVVRQGANILQPQRIPTGSFILDFSLLGGIPTGRISQLIGAKHSGKSMMAAKISGYAQRMFPEQSVVWIDIEKAFEPIWAAKLGCDTEALQVVEADTGEMAVDIADAVVGSDDVSLLVLDSLAALVPIVEVEDSAEDNHIALQSRLISRFLRKITGSLIRERMRGHEVTCLVLNQWRTKIGVFHGDPRTAPGGHAAEHFPSTTIHIRNKETHGKDREFDIDTVVENEHAYTLNKHRLNNGPRTGEFRLNRIEQPEKFLREGDIDDAKTILSYAKKMGAYSGGGKSWTFAFADYEHRVGGKDEAILFLTENREWYWALYNWCIRSQAIHLGMADEFIARFEV